MKKVKILTITLAVIAITMIAFLGVYTKVQNRMENQVKDYDLSMDLTGERNIRLKVSSQNKTIIKDKEGKEVDNSENLTDDEIKEKGYTKEEIPYNKEEEKKLENYQIAKKIIEKRLEKLKVNYYVIKLDEQTGDIVIELAENEDTDSVISNLYTTGKFEIMDSETKEVLLSNRDIKQAKVMYGTDNTTANKASTTVYLDIEFTKEAAKKLEEISNQYVKIEETEDQINEAEPQDETQTEQNAEENSQENTDKTTEKKISMKIDDEEIMSTSFEKPVKTGKLQLSVGSASTDQEGLQENLKRASSMATVLDTGNMPLKYDLSENQYVLTEITQNQMQIAIYIVLAIVVVACIIWLIKYKALGALGVISFIGWIALFMLLIRYANVTISMEGALGIVIAGILNYMLVSQLLAKPEQRKEVYQKFVCQIIPIIILVITFSFMAWTPISSFGMVMFWGIVLILVYNWIVTNLLLKIQTGKEK